MVLDVEPRATGGYAGHTVKANPRQKDPSTRGAPGYVVRLETDGDELPLPPEPRGSTYGGGLGPGATPRSPEC